MFFNALNCLKSVLGYDKKRSLEDKVALNLALIKEEKMKQGSKELVHMHQIPAWSDEPELKDIE